MYLEWAPSNVLSLTPKANEMSKAVGENDAKREILKQQVDGLSDTDIDPDRVEVRHISLLFSIYSCSSIVKCSFVIVFLENSYMKGEKNKILG